MEGVILFADDEIYSEKITFEKSLYRSLCNKNKHPIIGVTNLDLAENALRSLSSVKAFVVDYIFKEKSESAEISLPDRRALEILTKPNLSIFSLIYVYSQSNIENTPEGEKLKNIYKDRIRFKIKSSDNDKVDLESDTILADIDQWEKEHENYTVHFKWNQSINQAVQNIFTDLEYADINWISELYKTSKEDGAEPSVEVINLFQNILSEKIIQNDELRQTIKDYAEKGSSLSRPEDYAKLISILYYGQTNSTDPIMTGDIFKFDENNYGILITPECDIRDILKEPSKRQFELLNFSQKDFKKSELAPKLKLKASPLFTKAKEIGIILTKGNCEILSNVFNRQIEEEKKQELIKSFTQTYSRFHLLPCFAFERGDYTRIAMIDFRFGLDLRLANDLSKESRCGKLNTPYIQELRQRYLSYKGRVGVPRFSYELRKWLLEEKEK